MSVKNVGIQIELYDIARVARRPARETREETRPLCATGDLALIGCSRSRKTCCNSHRQVREGRVPGAYSPLRLLGLAANLGCENALHPSLANPAAAFNRKSCCLALLIPRSFPPSESKNERPVRPKSTHDAR